MIRVVLPAQLRALAGLNSAEVHLEVLEPPTQRSVLDALESAYPVLGGTLRDRQSGERRSFIRIFGCEKDLSHEPPDSPLPAGVASGAEPLLVIGAMAGG